MSIKKPQNDVPLEIPLRKVGNSLVLTIPAEICKLYGLKEGSTFELLPTGDRLTLRSKQKAEPSE
ncbi:growth regulator [Candidatus Methanoperedens nitroreducens]|uniref:Growth regulator n=1 Tax=Candidatus Methanoperedens nitratireducens TaxID=1392998 RepID=A0A062VCD4_9EURY|nr:AbrB/MazE/SpoVT family DNA-binding domain-containing protein [Candidatus Methanoperedens nitroreducens]KCZ73349.1 growth regulator [Candidatus Methanoperedens nitroreducens]MDJ1422702.1 AbrB/MazE/SpoVT family DNA-binding domain-containing protein [Candidatus Methanoperedens sp.]